MDGQGHLLSLKVMRVSRPALSSAWKPFYSSSPSFSAHSTTSILSLQGKTPLPGHPKTLRDLTQASDFLALPSSFGAIQLGETFSSCICVNNDAGVDVQDVAVRVEIQTANSKINLAELGGTDYKLAAGDSLETVVHHEVKELGQHVLACFVTYRLPPGFRQPPGPADDQNNASFPSFRKFYKFAVTNPLSVKTKVHTPKSPSALLSQVEREKVFLEIHIQNLTPEPMWFERMNFECGHGWTATDANTIDDGDAKEELFSGSTALMQPQAIRQYIYVLSPSVTPSFPVSHPPGTVIPLGRLDISWRSQFGEPGRLLTSMLSRRIPAPPQPPVPLVQQAPASALPPYLQRNVPATPPSPSRPHSPQLPPSRPSSPPPTPFRPGSPFRNRAPPGPSRPQSPGPGSTTNISVAPHQQPAAKVIRLPELEVDLLVQHISRDAIHVEKPFDVTFRLSIAGTIPRFHGRWKQRLVSVAVQHLQLPRIAATSEPTHAPDTSSRFSSSGFSSLSSTVPPVQTAFVSLTDNPVVASPQKMLSGSPFLLPPPCFEISDDEKRAKLKGCTFLGTSALFLDPIRLSHSSELHTGGAMDDHVGEETFRAEASCDFDLTYLPLQSGFVGVGGLRIMLVGDEIVDPDAVQPRTATDGEHKRIVPQIMKELDVVAEVWVKA
ncbi:DUF974-domain-containing protein [Leucogyrophana mollusca]|uniref:DUF974-domain-containing protein n=1 Tax=Leucogyrophana mollusca TaxID=85980 RepID=A0ACB8BT05_9AGAM|nr:DUF974-domain-containing protein [Leucogyrophana mollusca]